VLLGTSRRWRSPPSTATVPPYRAFHHFEGEEGGGGYTAISRRYRGAAARRNKARLKAREGGRGGEGKEREQEDREREEGSERGGKRKR